MGPAINPFLGWWWSLMVSNSTLGGLSQHGQAGVILQEQPLWKSGVCDLHGEQSITTISSWAD